MDESLEQARDRLLARRALIRHDIEIAEALLVEIEQDLARIEEGQRFVDQVREVVYAERAAQLGRQN